MASFLRSEQGEESRVGVSESNANKRRKWDQPVDDYRKRKHKSGYYYKQQRDH